MTLNWLKDYVDIPVPPQELADLLTMSGLEVESLETVGQGLDDILAARILSVEPHPKADRLRLCHVDAGGETVQVVCGAPNAAPEVIAPLALPGARLPDGSEIRETRIRGVSSRGMLLAEDELGLTDDHTGIMTLSREIRPGSSLSAISSLEDWVFEVAITPNRPDCASLMGVAREIAALLGKTLERPTMDLHEGPASCGALSSVTLEDPKGCPRYVAGIIQEVELKQSPFWMRYRLHLCGIRSINNIVDVTNYVLLEMGQPLHAFDYDRLRENRIVVKRAQEGEAFTTLDGETRTLNSETLMICDGERPVALAGIMGGLNSEIFAGTRHVLLESAFFDPVTIRRTSKLLGLSTEASYRFERGVDIEGADTALKRALSLMQRLGGGRVARGIIDNYPSPHVAPTIRLRPDKTNLHLGTRITGKEMAEILRSLEMDARETSEARELEVIPPSFRVDISREVDLMEEVARLSGYENIPVTYPRIRASEEGRSRELILRDRLRTIMTGLGFTEIISYSFVSPDSADTLGAAEDSPLRSMVRIMNPLSRDQSVMRTSLVPGLLGAIRTNVLHGERDLRLFEWGRIFFDHGEEQLPRENIAVGAAMCGAYQRKAWFNDGRAVDFYDIKGSVEALLNALGLNDVSSRPAKAQPGYDPDVLSEIRCPHGVLGHLGLVATHVREAYELENEPVYLFEMQVQPLLEEATKPSRYRPYPRFPAVYRDLSLVVKRKVESATIAEIIKSEGGDLVESARIFDLYEGKNVGPTEKALAFRISFRSDRETLDGDTVNRLHEAIVQRIAHETGGRLREG
mgnify:CR=1 FL=1